MREVVIASAVRTAIGKFGGSLKDTGPVQLGSVVLKDAILKAGADKTSLNSAAVRDPASGLLSPLSHFGDPLSPV